MHCLALALTVRKKFPDGGSESKNSIKAGAATWGKGREAEKV